MALVRCRDARYADAMAAVESARDLVLGSFNVYATRTAQRTNDTMKVLTLVTVLLLPGSLIAGPAGHERHRAARQGRARCRSGS